jgi:hypothetical protein
MDGHEATGVWDRHSGDILGHQFGIMLNGFHGVGGLYVSSLDKSGNRVVRDLGLMLGFASSYTGHAFDVALGLSSPLPAMTNDLRSTDEDERSTSRGSKGRSKHSSVIWALCWALHPPTPVMRSTWSRTQRPSCMSQWPLRMKGPPHEVQRAEASIASFERHSSHAQWPLRHTTWTLRPGPRIDALLLGNRLQIIRLLPRQVWKSSRA